eukprot:TRINITY_DN5961_c0_g1_i1.p1 TRINITY_DN5961_c0_g1~~TRINITY_DN5961_c0_g1_i1.p1  ORF type:complete len:473 (+),score=145.12 TRINITY_DN5961_c0_g1_i1:90-1421(+)
MSRPAGVPGAASDAARRLLLPPPPPPAARAPAWRRPLAPRLPAASRRRELRRRAAPISGASFVRHQERTAEFLNLSHDLPDGLPREPERLLPSHMAHSAKVAQQRTTETPTTGRRKVHEYNAAFHCGYHLVLWHEERQQRVELVPLFICCVSRWYVMHVLALISTVKHYSTVYLGNPMLSPTQSTAPAKTRTWSTRLALELSLTDDFPALIPIPDMSTAPLFSRVESTSEWLRGVRHGGGPGVDKLADALAAGAHSRDTVCVLASPAALLRIAHRLSSSAGWRVGAAQRMHISVRSHRRYGLAVSFLQRCMTAAAVLWLVLNYEIIWGFCQRQLDRARALSGMSTSPDMSSTGAVPVEEVRYFSHAYNPEQELALKSLRRKLLADQEGCPPGRGVDTKPHVAFFDRTGVKQWNSGLMGWLPDGAPVEGPEWDKLRLPPEQRGA